MRTKRLAALAAVMVLAIGAGGCGTPAGVVDRLIEANEFLEVEVEAIEQKIADLENDPNADAARVAELRELKERFEAERKLNEARLARLDGKGDDLGWLELVLSSLGAAVAAYLGVEYRRGSPTHRKGLPPKAPA